MAAEKKRMIELDLPHRPAAVIEIRVTSWALTRPGERR